jgi:hypothetical protein
MGDAGDGRGRDAVSTTSLGKWDEWVKLMRTKHGWGGAGTPGTGRSGIRSFHQKRIPNIPSCYWCGVEFSVRMPTVDHLVPTSSGGTNNHANLVASCGDCNSRKGSTDPHDFLPVSPALIRWIVTDIEQAVAEGATLTADLFRKWPRGAVISLLHQKFGITIPHGYPDT